MKIVISSSGQKTSSLLDPRFGRCAFFALYDTEKREWGFLPNPGALEGSGAGVKAAQFLLLQDIEVVLTGNVGPNVADILNTAGIKAYALPEVTLEEAVKQYEEGQGSLITGATVDAHAGLDLSRETSRQVESPLPQGKIAIATEGTEVAQHFGRCQAYTLAEIKDGVILNKTVIPSPGHQPGFLPRFLAEKGVKCIIAGGMGPRAQNLFLEQGITAIVGVTGSVAETLENYLSDSLAEGASLCEHGRGGGSHQCGEH